MALDKASASLITSNLDRTQHERRTSMQWINQPNYKTPPREVVPHRVWAASFAQGLSSACDLRFELEQAS